jgi:hypothetical protein
MTPDGKKLFNEKLVKKEKPEKESIPTEDRHDFSSYGFD